MEDRKSEQTEKFYRMEIILRKSCELRFTRSDLSAYKMSKKWMQKIKNQMEEK